MFTDLLSPGGPRRPCHPRVIPASSPVVSKGYPELPVVPVIPASSPSSPRRPRSPRCLPGLSYPISSSTTPGDTRASSPRGAHRADVVSLYLMLSPPPTMTSNPSGT